MCTWQGWIAIVHIFPHYISCGDGEDDGVGR